jgi:hypothetical protein
MSAYNPNFQMPQLGRQVNWGLDIQLPDYWKSVFTPDKSSKGTNTTPGQVSRDFPSIDYTSTGPAIPGVSPQFQEWLNFTKAMSPIHMEQQAQAAQLSAALTEQQLASLYPYLKKAAEEGALRNYGLSVGFLQEKERTPSAQQARMASASSSEADMLRAVAAARGVAGFRRA